MLEAWFSGEAGINFLQVFQANVVARTQDKPEYLPGLWACMAASLIIIVTVCLLDVYFFYANAKASRGELAIEGAQVDSRFVVF